MEGNVISVFAGLGLSLMFSYIPGAKAWYGVLDGQRKALVMLALLLVASIVIYGLSCVGYATAVSCNENGLLELGELFFAALVANQMTYNLTPSERGSAE